jgi:SAM-dependent methyltransferase
MLILHNKHMRASYNLLLRALRRLSEIPRRGFPTLRPNRTSFDEQWGTETEKIVWLTNPGSKNFVHGVRYEACSPTACGWAIENAPVDLSRFYFVDVGCGKGRPLLIASQYPFKHLVGIEYSAKLCDQAHANLTAAGVSPARFRIFCIDAVDFEFTPQDTFAYLHNPFDHEILSQVLRRLRKLAETNRLVVAYEGPRREQLAHCPWLHLLANGPSVSLFGSRNVQLATGTADPLAS